MPVNMQYCQFKNTLAALRELDFSDSHFKNLSSEEREARFDLVDLMMSIAEPFAEEQFKIETFD